jgi:hypothetical protein
MMTFMRCRALTLVFILAAVLWGALTSFAQSKVCCNSDAAQEERRASLNARLLYAATGACQWQFVSELSLVTKAFI